MRLLAAVHMLLLPSNTIPYARRAVENARAGWFIDSVGRD